MQHAYIETVTKEQIPKLHCTNDEVLHTDGDIKARYISLQQAAHLSRNFYYKAKIVFETQEGLKEVRTTVWATTDQYILLKGGVSLPICCVREVVVEHEG
jgi:hypothetical protein